MRNFTRKHWLGGADEIEILEVHASASETLIRCKLDAVFQCFPRTVNLSSVLLKVFGVLYYSIHRQKTSLQSLVVLRSTAHCTTVQVL
jgi:hypothetical protein